MSLKNLDNKGRWRNKTVAFRISPEENEQLERFVRRDQFATVLEELRRIDSGSAVDGDLMDTITMIAVIMDGMKGGIV